MLWNLETLWPLWRNPFAGLSWRLRRSQAVSRRARSHWKAGPESWRRDPLSHPALQAMSQRELGDLPFDPRCATED